MSALEIRELGVPIARAFGAAPCVAAYRIAPDEWLLVGDEAIAALSAGDHDVVDFTSGFVCLELSGEGWEEAFRYLSDLELPQRGPALIQGRIAEVEGKAIAGSSLILLIPPVYAHHVRKAVLGLSDVGFQTREVTPERAVA